MGLIYADIELTNHLMEDAQPYFTKALVDTDALPLCIPQHVSYQLKLKQLEKREVTIADGTKKLIPYMGPVKIIFKNRNCFTSAMVLGEEALPRAIPMEDMDFVIQPALLKVTVNPESPNILMSVAK